MTIDIMLADPTPDATAAGRSAVSWAAVIAGAVVAAAVTLILLAVGSGIGFATTSPWTSIGAAAMRVSVGAAIWLIVTQWIASGLGGYLTGRLRTRWIGTHSHEVFFRDTAHGFLAWALATVFAAGVLSSLAIKGAGVGSHVVSEAAGMTRDGAASADRVPQALAYDVDFLFRSARAADPASALDTRLQAVHILEVGVKDNAVSADDAAYLAQLVATQTGLAPVEAEQRVAIVISRERNAVAAAGRAADSARKAAASLSILTALSMLVGALIASVSAALGGQQRDEHP